MRKRPRQGRSRVTVTSILEAADRILRLDGYDAASTNRLARVAGFSVGSLYQYFRDKQGIVGALIDRELASEAEGLVALLEQRGGSVLDALAGVVTVLFDRRAQRAHIYRALDQHAAELGAPLILDHMIAAQAPILSDVLQRVSAQLFPRSARSIDARLYMLSRMTSQASYAHAVDAPTSLPRASVCGAFVAAAGRYLGEEAPGSEAIALAETWAKGTPRHASPAELRLRRRRESRAALLASGVDAAELEARAFLLGCLGEVSAATTNPPAGLGAAELQREAAHFVEALRRP